MFPEKNSVDINASELSEDARERFKELCDSISAMNFRYILGDNDKQTRKWMFQLNQSWVKRCGIQNTSEKLVYEVNLHWCR